METPPDDRRSTGRAVGATLGLLLLAGAAILLWRSRPDLVLAFDSLQDPAPRHLAILLGSMVGSIVVTGLLFSVLTARYGRVGLLEMQALIGASALLNYLPLRAGMVGRIAYHKAVNGIRPIDSGKVVLLAWASSFAVAGVMLLLLGASTVVGLLPVAAIAGPAALAAAGAVSPAWRPWCVAFLLRWCDLVLLALRYHAAFALLGYPVTPSVAAGVACVGMVVGAVPFLSNGLGVREWAVGITASVITDLPAALALGVMVDLVHRAAEMVVFLVAGGWGLSRTLPALRSRDPLA